MLILLLNYAPALLALLVFLTVLWFFYLFVNTVNTDKKAGKKLAWRVLVTALVAIVLKVVVPAFNNSITPKGTVDRIPLPAWEQRDDLVVQDRTLKPSKTEEQRQRDLDKKLDWKASKAQAENK